MADQSSVNVPWAGLAVVVALVSSTLLVPHAFDQLRPPEKERAQMPEAVDLEIDARLWEDPFFALRRFENERTERCDKLAPKGALTNEIAKDCQPGYRPDQRDPAKFVDKRLFDRDRNGDLEETLVVAALVPGNPFVGAEESRRRTRYALLAGLQSQGYVPDNAERIGLLQFNEPEQIDPTSTAASAAGATPATVAASPAAPAPAASAARAKPANAKLMIPYELLSERPQLRDDPPKKPRTRYAQIALPWVDEAALEAPKLDSLALLINELFKEKAWCKHPRLAIVGPSSSDALRVALRDLNLASLAQPPDETQAQLLQIVHEGCSEERAALWAASVGATQRSDSRPRRMPRRRVRRSLGGWTGMSARAMPTWRRPSSSMPAPPPPTTRSRSSTPRRSRST